MNDVSAKKSGGGKPPDNKGNGGIFSIAIQTVPRLRGPIQLVGLIFSIFSAALIQRVDPDNIQALAIVGAIAVALITLPMAFHGNFLRHIPKQQIVPFLLILILLLLVSFSATAFITYQAVIGPRPEGARFDAVLAKDGIAVFRNADGSGRVEVTLNLVPLSPEPDGGATVFLGMINAHDDQIPNNLAAGTSLSCAEVPSCLGNYLFPDLENSPVLVKGGCTSSTVTRVFSIRKIPERLRVYWEFYQVEGIGKARCGIDRLRRGPAEGIPPLAMYDSRGVQIDSICYGARGRRVVDVSTVGKGI